MRELQAEHKNKNGSTPDELCVMATGGGAFKYYDRITEALGVEVIREDEMECLIIGMAHVPAISMLVLLTTATCRTRLFHK